MADRGLACTVTAFGETLHVGLNEVDEDTWLIITQVAGFIFTFSSTKHAGPMASIFKDDSLSTIINTCHDGLAPHRIAPCN